MESFNHLNNWISDAKQYSRPDATYLLLGNKKDLVVAGERQVDYISASQYAQENECLLFETSAKTGENIE